MLLLRPLLFHKTIYDETHADAYERDVVWRRKPPPKIAAFVYEMREKLPRYRAVEKTRTRAHGRKALHLYRVLEILRVQKRDEGASGRPFEHDAF